MPLPSPFTPGDDWKFQPGLPLVFKNPHLPGALSAHCKNDCASIVTQLYNSQLYSFCYTVAHFFKNFQSVARMDIPGLYVRFQLQAPQRMKLNTGKKMQIRENHFAGFYIEKGSCDFRFRSGKNYHTLDLYYSPEFLQEYCKVFPQVGEMLEKSETTSIPAKPSWIQQELQDVIQSILKPYFDKDSISIHYDVKARDILNYVLHYKFKRAVAKLQFSPFEITRVHLAKKILSTFISKKPPELHYLADKVGLSIGKLREGFQQEFNSSTLDWLVEEKMKLARYLVETTREPIGLIGYEVGYPRVSNFIKAYRKKYGMSPGKSRQKGDIT